MKRAVIITLFLFTRLGAPQGDQSYELTGPGFEIRVLEVFCSGPEPQLCFLNYSYSFPGHSHVYIEGIGQAPAIGSFRYYSKNRLLQFSEDRGGKGLAIARFRETSVTRGANPELPTFRDFPQTQSSSGSVPADQMFSVKAQQVLNQRFPSGFDPDEVRSGVHYYITTYAPVESGQKNLLLQVAVMLSNPEPAEQPNAFRVRWIAREKNRLDPDWRLLTSDSPEMGSVERYIREVIRDFDR
jgi:hypothetical protein